MSDQLPEIGTYFISFAIQVEMERYWDLREFRDGWAFWLLPEHRQDAEGNRDANPWQHISPDRERSWDAGYMIGHAFKYNSARILAALNAIKANQ